MPDDDGRVRRGRQLRRFYMPGEGSSGYPIKCLSGGAPTPTTDVTEAQAAVLQRYGSEALTMNVANQDTLWEASEAAVRASFFGGAKLYPVPNLEVGYGASEVTVRGDIGSAQPVLRAGENAGLPSVRLSSDQDAVLVNFHHGA